MFEWAKARVLRLMRVPREPEPPAGAPGSVRIFRAGLNHYRLRVLRWYFAQAGAIVGIGFSLVMLGAFESAIEQARQRGVRPVPSPALEAAPPSPSASPSPQSARSREERRRSQERALFVVATKMPPYVIPLIEFLEFAGIALFLVQMLVTYAIVRLEFEQHWYIVTDRSLRIRTGILRLQEATMSFANLQQVEIRQGPLQRFLALADVCVRSAGGGDPAAGPKGHGQETSLHLGTFEGVPNAVEIRDLILERLRKFREAGLGDPEDARAHVHVPLPSSAARGRSLADAAAELVTEARALRTAVGAGP
ncbi:MAG: PH domain-containing protein [Vicinamibacteria bacterium]